MDTRSLVERLQSPDIANIVVGPWPPSGLQPEKMDGLIQTRALILETLDLMLAKSLQPAKIDPLSEKAAEASEALNKIGVGFGSGKLTETVHRSIVGKWPPDGASIDRPDFEGIKKSDITGKWPPK
ncbi:hypothetical protein [Erythrobacter crassostreae]|uniref:Uncharacterized protein n=1 Tax=Erythrobacter crassostreae TaxID=2828328 RepID=A0A9X1F384_9SPHN|nr:hypothetical protein [Erythrobacter crassostrea]MBV7258874.1 hypothetical protein [Erythrobacter crassostrea]